MKELFLIIVPAIALILCKLMLNNSNNNNEGPFDCYVHGGR